MSFGGTTPLTNPAEVTLLDWNSDSDLSYSVSGGAISYTTDSGSTLEQAAFTLNAAGVIPDACYVAATQASATTMNLGCGFGVDDLNLVYATLTAANPLTQIQIWYLVGGVGGIANIDISSDALPFAYPFDFAVGLTGTVFSFYVKSGGIWVPLSQTFDLSSESGTIGPVDSSTFATWLPLLGMSSGNSSAGSQTNAKWGLIADINGGGPVGPFEGTTPLDASSELTGFTISGGSFFSWNASDGILTYNEAGEDGTTALFLINASTTQTDKCYVSNDIIFENFAGGTMYPGVGFGLDATHYVYAYGVANDGTHIDAVQISYNNGGSVQNIGVPVDRYGANAAIVQGGLPFGLALGISGTTLSFYINRHDGKGWLQLPAAYNLKSADSAITSTILQTWRAVTACTGGDVSESQVSNVAWGSISDLGVVYAAPYVETFIPGYSPYGQMPTDYPQGGCNFFRANLAIYVNIHDLSPGADVVVSSPNLDWVKWYSISSTAGESLITEVWYAIVEGPLVTEPVTYTAPGGLDSYGAFCFGVVGAAVPTPFDGGDGTLPAGNTTGSPNLNVTFSTTNKSDLVLVLSSLESYGGPNVPAPFTYIGSGFSYSGARQVEVKVGTWSPGGLLHNYNSISGLTPGQSNSYAAFAIEGQTGTVPDVVGEQDSDARADIIGAGMTVGTITTEINYAPPAQVLSQSPAGGSTVTQGTPVNLLESLGLVVPNVVNTSATEIAPGIIEAAQFVIGAVSYDTSVLIIPGNIIKQHPLAGAYAAGGSPIDIVISTGRGGVYVPDVLSLDQTDATAACVALGLLINTVTTAPSLIYPAGEVIAQNPSGGTPVEYGSFVSLIISSGPPVPDVGFDFEATVISQYANSPTILQLATSMNKWIDQSSNFANFYAFIWNVDTAEDWGLDIWGKIVNVSRLLTVTIPSDYVGFNDGTGPTFDVQPFGPGGKGTFYNPALAFEQYVLSDSSYRVLILAKAFANLITNTVPALNQLLQNMFPGRGNAYVTSPAPMELVINLAFTPTAVELAILNTSGVFPTPVGCSLSISST